MKLLVAGAAVLLLASVSTAAAPPAGGVVFWGCRPVDPGVTVKNYGQCSVPGRARSGVVAIAAAFAHNLALKKDGSVIAWGCGGIHELPSVQCSRGCEARHRRGRREHSDQLGPEQEG